MRLVVCGLNHQTAPLPIREKLAFNSSHVTHALQDLLNNHAVNEAVLLSTCNRTEVYTAAEQAPDVLNWLSQQPSVRELNAAQYCYQHQNFDMIRHAMRVASGLDSMILGEPQILGQMKQAYSLACETGAVGSQFQQLFPAIFAVSKQIRSQTAIGANPVSIAYTVVQLAKRLFSSINNCRVLLMGAGETIGLIATHLHGQGVQHLLIANRTLERAEQLAQPVAARAIRMAEIPQHLKDMDIVISATTSQLPVLGKGAIESALHYRKHRPMLLIDLAVPRDIEPEVSQLEDVYLYNLDDVQAVVEKNWQSREAAAKQAEAMVDMQALHYLRHLRVLKSGDLIRRFRERYAQLRDDELNKAIAHWRKTNDPQAALAYLANNLTNKMLHDPTVKLRQAAYEEKMELLLLIRELFEI
jgi:glutamyl-tRNA reductase